MQLGILSDEISQDFQHALAVICELGGSHVEVRNLWNKGILQLSGEELDRAKRLIGEHQLSVSAVAAPLFKVPLDDTSAYEEHLSAVDGYLRLARELGTDKIRVFGFMRSGELTDSVIDQIAGRLEPAVKKAEEAGAMLVLENEHQTYIGNGEASRRLLDRLPSPSLGLIWDPGNAFRTGETPFPDGYDFVRERTLHFHIKDASRDGKGGYTWQPVGAGEIDLASQVRALLEDGYEGVIVLETHYAPAGGSKEDGTRISWRGLRDLLNRIDLAS